MIRLLCLLLLTVAFCMPLAAQPTVFQLGTATTTTGFNQYPCPYGNWYWGARHQFLVPASELQALGMSAGDITALAFEVTGVQGTVLENFEIRLGNGAAGVGFTGGLTTVWGPADYADQPGWNIHGFQQPFTWDGTSDLVVETCFNNSSYTGNSAMSLTSTTYTASIVHRRDATGVCTGSTVDVTSSDRPVMRFFVGGAEFGTNSSNSELSFDGVLGDLVAPAEVSKCGGALTQAAFASDAVGFPYEVLITSDLFVPASAGGLVFGDEILNVDLGQPVTFLNGGLAPDLVTSAFPNAFSVPFNSPPVGGRLGAQMVNVTPAAAVGVATSQPCAVIGVTPLPITCNDADEGITTIPFGAFPLCGPGSFPFYGQSFPEMTVTSNGMVIFGTPGNDPYISLSDVLTGEPRVGYWTDLEPTLQGGTIVVTNLGGGVLRVDYTNCAYYCTPATVTFGIEFDSNSGNITIDGLTGIQVNPGTCGSQTADSAFLGISGGNLIGATDPGTQDFDPITGGGAGAASNPADALYDLALQTPAFGPVIVPSVAAGNLFAITFIPDGNGNYIWTSF